MPLHFMENSSLSTIDPALNLPEQVRWDTVEAVRQERVRISREEYSSGSEGALSEQDDEGSGDEENLLYSLWCELRHGAEKETDFSTDLNSLPSSEARFDRQSHAKQWEDKAHVVPMYVETRRVRIEERSRIQPVNSKQEFDGEEEEWEDTAAVQPQVKGVRKVRIIGKKRLKPSAIPGEFDDEQ